MCRKEDGHQEGKTIEEHLLHVLGQVLHAYIAPLDVLKHAENLNAKTRVQC